MLHNMHMRHFKYLYMHKNLFFTNVYVCLCACLYTRVMNTCWKRKLPQIKNVHKGKAVKVVSLGVCIWCLAKVTEVADFTVNIYIHPHLSIKTFVHISVPLELTKQGYELCLKRCHRDKKLIK